MNNPIILNDLINRLQGLKQVLGTGDVQVFSSTGYAVLDADEVYSKAAVKAFSERSYGAYFPEKFIVIQEESSVFDDFVSFDVDK